MKSLINRLLVIVIVIAAPVALISVAASADNILSEQHVSANGLNPQVADAKTLYVKPDGTGDCSTWAKACVLQTALSKAASGDEIWVAMGVQYPDEGSGQSDKDPRATFQLRDEVAIYGGFNGVEIGRDQRDWEENITVLSGDLEGNDKTDANGVITDTANVIGLNSENVVSCRYGTDKSVLDGFTITGGNADGSGGGMNNFQGNTTLTNVTFSGNMAEGAGGGMSNAFGTATLTNVIFSGNSAVSRGGGLFLIGSSQVITLLDVTFSGNSAANFGGGMSIEDGRTTLTNVTFSGNKAVNGGGMSSEFGRTSLTNVTFSGNIAEENGGGLYHWKSNSTLTNVTFSGNTAASYGGGIYNFEDSIADNGTLMMTNCSISNNIADVDGTGGGGGGIYVNSSFPACQVKNCVIAGNRLGGGSSDINSDIHGAFTSQGYNFIGDGTGSTGFTDWVNHDQVGNSVHPIDPILGDLALNRPGSTLTLALLDGSPAIDQGSCPGFTSDQRGAPRPDNFPNISDADDGCDIGAFELQEYIEVSLPLIVNRRVTK